MTTRFGQKITDLVLEIHKYPFVGILLRVYITDTEMDDLRIFNKALKMYPSHVKAMGKAEIEKSFDIFSNIKTQERLDYIALYKILTIGFDSL